MKKISIVTPSYNQGAFLEETICSVLDQNYPNLEFIVIDGGSKDNSVEVIKKYEKHLDYWISEPDGGQTQAINKGLKRVTGEIVNWINSDDTLAQGALQTVESLFEANPMAGLVHGKTIVFNDSLANKSSYLVKGTGAAATRTQALGRIVFPQPSAFFKREVLDNQGYLKENLQYGMDYDLFVRTVGNYQIVGTNEILSYYRLHSTSKTTTSTALFYKDWNATFCALLRALPFNEPYIKLLKELQLYNTTEDQIFIGNTFSKAEVNEIFYYYLTNGIGHHYENLNLKFVKKVLNLTKKNCPKVFHECALENMHLRANLLPESLLKVFRNFSRK